MLTNASRYNFCHMVKRSLQASPDGIKQAKKAFAQKAWTQENLADLVHIRTRQPIWRFFTGRPIERYTFIEICSVLELNWREMVENLGTEVAQIKVQAPSSVLDIDTLVQEVRSQRQDEIQDQCGTLQLLDISHQVSIDDIYIDVNILEDIASFQWLEVSHLQNLGPDGFERFGLGEVSQKQIPGKTAVEIYSKLRVLGKPGAGKTTFLQHLAILCNRGELAANRVPIFITLREYAEDSRDAGDFSLLNYIRREFLSNGILDPAKIETLLHEGRVLLLLDGLDELLNQDSSIILKEIRKFSNKYHKNLFVATCRTSAEKFKLTRFTDIEIAPFTSEQIAAFAQRWFVALTLTNAQDGLAQSVEFIEQISSPKNWQFRKLAVTPLFLHVACWVFHRQEKFPIKRAEFYQQCVNLLLGKWDEAKGVERDEVYRGFLLPQKIKLLSQIAATAFEQGRYFFEERVVEQYIADYIRDLPAAPTDPEELFVESVAVLKAIEAQHGLLAERARGIFSFSYLAFQEYFTARKIVASHNLQALEQALSRLVSHITEPRWREVFLLTATMLRSADALVQLMKQQIDALLAQDKYLQEFLTWASQKSSTIPAESKEAVVRAFYLALDRTPHLAPHFALACTLDQGMFLDAALDDLVLSCAVGSSSDFAHAHACAHALSNAVAIVLDVGLHQSLQQLQDQLPDPNQDRERFQTWWQANHPAWAERLKAAITEHRQIHYYWEFSPEQQQVLQRYYDANKLLIDCLNSNSEVTTAVRQEIEASLLLPQKELAEREWQSGISTKN